MKKKFSHVIAHYLPQCLLLISLLTSNVLFPATVIAQEIENTNNVTQEETVPIDTSEDILEEGISTSIYEEEEVVEPLFVFENGIYTVNTVVEGEEYVYPDNNDVRVKFTEVTQEGNLIIKRVELTEEQKELLNTKDNYGWDITSSMDNGTFKYNLTLPNTHGNEDIEVKYTEDNNTYESIDNSNIEIKSNVVTIEGLDHFTVFVVVNPLPDNYTEGASNCTIMTGSICYDTIQEAVTAATSGDTINVLAGEYHENITINKSLSLMGVGEGNKPTIVGGVIISTSGAVSIENMNFKVPSVTSVDSIHINNVDGELQLHVKNCSFDGSSQFLNGKRGIQSDDSQSKVTVEGSTFSNGYYIAIQGKYNELNISNSTISNCKSGINFQSGNNLSVTDTNISVVAQTISNDTYAVRFASDGTNTGNKMTLNGGKYVVDKNGLIADSNTYHSAIIVRSGASGVLKANNLSLGGEVVNLSGQKLDATKNWWGDLDPSDNIKNSGTGSIDYSPWWGEDYANDDHSSAWTWYTNDSIQEAVNVATSGDIVNVKAGTYYERVVINKSLRLYGVQANVDPRPSVGGRTGVETIVNGNGSQILQIDADNVEINGFEFVNGGGYMIDQKEGPYSSYVFQYNIVHNQNGDDAVKVRKCTNCLVSNNYIYDIASPGDGIGLSGGINSAIRNNELVNQSSENAAIYVYDSTNTSITGNIVRGTTQNDGIKLGHKKGYNAEGVGGEIKNNVVSDTAQDGISVYMSNVVVDGNEISGSSSTNGALYLAFGISNVTITNNKIHDNTSASGIKIESSVNASTVKINNNQIFNNTNYGLYNFANTLLNAKSNWWGDNDNSGPYDEWSDGSNPLTNLTGNGNSVRGMVDYSSWIEADKTIPNTTSPRMFVSHDGGITFEERTYVTKGDIVRVETDATDNLSGIDYVQFSIKNPSGGYVANYEKIYAPISTGSDTYRFEFTIPADGKYIDTHELITEDINGLNFWVRAYDNAGNYNHGTSNTFTYDKTQPTISEPRMYVSRNGQPYKLSNTVKPGDRVKVQAEAEDSSSGIRSVEFRIQDKSTGEYIAPRIFEETPISGNTYEYIFQIPTDGKYINTHNPISEEYLQLSYWVRAHDIVGNYAHGAFDLFTLDTTDPSVPTNGSPNNSIISTNEFDFTWDASTDVSTITYEFQSSLNPSQVDGVLTTELWKSGTLPTNTIHSSGASDGIWYWQVRAKDAAGNYSDWSEIWTVTIDTTAPTKPVITNTPDNAFTNINAITINWEGGDDQGTNPSGIKGYIIRYVFTSVNGNTVTDWTSGLVEVGNPKTHSGTYGRGEGKYVIYVKTVDNAGNESPESDSFTITYDITAPIVKLVSPIDNYYTNSTVVRQEWNTTATDVAYYDYRSCSNNPSDGTCNGIYTETKTVKYRNVYNNNITFWWQVRAVDLAGNIGKWSTPRKITIDTIAPVVHITSPSEGTYLKGTVELQGEIVDNNLWRYFYRVRNISTGINVKSDTVYTNSLNGTFYTWNTTSSADGKYIVHLAARDLADNQGTESIDEFQVTVDNTPPEGEIRGIRYDSQDIEGYFITNDNTPKLFGTCIDTNIDTVKLTIDKDTSNIQTIDLLCDSGKWVADITNRLLDGEYTATLTITDKAGNSFTTEQKLTIDTKAPFATHTYYKNGTKITDSKTYVSSINELTYTGIFEDKDSSGLYKDVLVVFRKSDNHAYCSWSQSLSPTGGISLNGGLYEELTTPQNILKCVNSLPEGEYYIRHRVYDNAIRSNAPAYHQHRQYTTLEFVIDSTAPTVEITSPSENSILRGTVEIKGSVQDTNPHHYYYKIEDKDGSIITDETIYTTENITDKVIYTWDTTKVDDGTYKIQLEAKDAADNKNASSIKSITVIVDNKTPTTTLTSDPSGTYVNTPVSISGKSIDINGVDSVNIFYRVTGTTDWTSITTLDNTPNTSPYDWSYTWTPSRDGTYDIKISATDTVGNIEQSAYIYSLTYDSTAPTITVFNIVSEILNISATDSLSGTDKIEVKINDGGWITYTTDMNLNTLLNNTPGTYTIYARVTDKAGNTTQGSTTYTIPTPAVLGATTGPTTTTKPSVKGTTTTKTTPNISEDTQTEDILETTSIEEPSVLGERCENKKKVSGYVYIDKNKDKQMNENEEGIKDITLTIQYTDEEGNIKTEEEVSTDEKGYWETQLCSGKYNIVVKEDTLPKNIEVPEVLSLTVSDNEKETIFNIQALDTRNFWQKYWYLIVGGLAIIVIGYTSIKNRKKEEI